MGLYPWQLSAWSRVNYSAYLSLMRTWQLTRYWSSLLIRDCFSAPHRGDVGTATFPLFSLFLFQSTVSNGDYMPMRFWLLSNKLSEMQQFGEAPFWFLWLRSPGMGWLEPCSELPRLKSKASSETVAVRWIQLLIYKGCNSPLSCWLPGRWPPLLSP